MQSTLKDKNQYGKSKDKADEKQLKKSKLIW